MLGDKRMTEEEYFRKNYPDYCYGDRLLSPYWDLFQDGVEFGEQQSEKKIEELKSELTKKADTNHSLVEQMAKLESDFRICEKNADTYYYLLSKATEIIKELLLLPYANNEEVFADVTSTLNKAEQFLKEIEK